MIITITVKNPKKLHRYFLSLPSIFLSSRFTLNMLHKTPTISHPTTLLLFVVVSRRNSVLPGQDRHQFGLARGDWQPVTGINFGLSCSSQLKGRAPAMVFPHTHTKKRHQLYISLLHSHQLLIYLAYNQQLHEIWASLNQLAI